MNLYNLLPVPAGLRHCYWDAEYIASQPFCITSRLSEIQAKQFAEYEELLFWERLDSLKQKLDEQARLESEETLEALKIDGVLEVAERGLKRLESITSNLCKDFFTNDTKKPLINRSDYLTR
jgi:hypothetical protein